MKKFFKICIALIIILILYWFVSPYWVLYQVSRAIEKNQTEQLIQYIDFPKVRESLEIQVNQKINQELARNHVLTQDMIAHGLQQLMIKPLLDATITPEMIMLVMQGKLLTDRSSQQIAVLSGLWLSKTSQLDQSDASSEIVANDGENKVEITQARFDTWNQFHVRIVLHQHYPLEVILQPEAGQWKIVKLMIVD
ncbi:MULTISPECIES: DUF2939 domain-containing protein [unclassified Acinetobacter]|uniref:DUF2939 domain-containing protein n=1 Tax=unclassified Acinetobacter TaxID=196816 RepID=UPI0029345326|nr:MULTISPECIES: DUF2939 domain-containing protein [unclassified Acinetobacter]WOE31343.1 DUF2939 domain-containing protein [Acinetobacter sp. SAAs470]WOE39539.1 DUF2939 domain-containing protein [Acinetobacter sp. SAAs474]